MGVSEPSSFRLYQTERDDNFKFDENARKFYKLVENTEGNGEIARYEQFLLLPSVFSKEDLPCRHIKTKACLGKG